MVEPHEERSAPHRHLIEVPGMQMCNQNGWLSFNSGAVRLSDRPNECCESPRAGEPRGPHGAARPAMVEAWPTALLQTQRNTMAPKLHSLRLTFFLPSSHFLFAPIPGGTVHKAIPPKMIISAPTRLFSRRNSVCAGSFVNRSRIEIGYAVLCTVLITRSDTALGARDALMSRHSTYRR